MKLLVTSLFGLFLLCGACSSSSDDNSTPSQDAGSDSAISPEAGGDSASNPSQTDWQTGCEAEYQRQVRCGHPEDHDAYLAECHKNYQCAAGLASVEYANIWVTCAAARPCDTDDDSCGDSYAQQHLDDPGVQDYIARCLQKNRECDDAGVYFVDDNCAEYVILNQAARDKYRPCIDKACADIQKCFDEAHQSLGCTN